MRRGEEGAFGPMLGALVGGIYSRLRATGVDLPMVNVRQVLDAAFAEIAERALAGQRVAFPGFGIFRRRTRKARVIFDLKTGGRRHQRATYRLSFTAAKRHTGEQP